MTIKSTKKGLPGSYIFFKGKAIVLVLLLVAWLPPSSGHAGQLTGDLSGRLCLQRQMGTVRPQMMQALN